MGVLREYHRMGLLQTLTLEASSALRLGAGAEASLTKRWVNPINALDNVPAISVAS